MIKKNPPNYYNSQKYFQHLISPEIKTLPSRETDENKDNFEFLFKTNT